MLPSAAKLGDSGEWRAPLAVRGHRRTADQHAADPWSPCPSCVRWRTICSVSQPKGDRCWSSSFGISKPAARSVATTCSRCTDLVLRLPGSNSARFPVRLLLRRDPDTDARPSGSRPASGPRLALRTQAGRFPRIARSLWQLGQTRQSKRQRSRSRVPRADGGCRFLTGRRR